MAKAGDKPVASFTDLQGDEWDLTLSVAETVRIKRLIGVDLLRSAKGNRAEQVATLMADPETFIGVLYAVVEPTARGRDIDSAEAFTSRFDLDTLRQSMEAFLRAVTALHLPPGPRRAAAFATLDRANRKADAAADAAAGEAVEALERLISAESPPADAAE